MIAMIAMIDGGLLQDSAQMKLDVLSIVHLIEEPCKLITPTTIKNCLVKCGFLSAAIRTMQ
jgi:hypothetical protein